MYVHTLKYAFHTLKKKKKKNTCAKTTNSAYTCKKNGKDYLFVIKYEM